jgi:hypothetical protein
MSYELSLDSATIQQWIIAKLEPEAVEKELLEKGLDKTAITTYLKAYKRVRNAKRQFTGFVCMGLGAFIGFISCMLTVFNPIPELYNIILFGLTSVAILIICLGMYFVFE